MGESTSSVRPGMLNIDLTAPEYEFKAVEGFDGISISGLLMPDHSIETTIANLMGRSWMLRTNPIQGSPDKLTIEIRWAAHEITIAVNGSIHERVTITRY